MVFETMRNYLRDVISKNSDPRVNYWLMDEPTTTIWACLLYITFVKVIGPKYMENRKPFELKNVILGYNIFQVILSSYIFYETFQKEWFTTSRILRCQPIDYEETSYNRRILRANYLYFLAKFTEFLDTIFFVLRKKNNQITFLHLYHHVCMPMYFWIVMKFYVGGSFILVPMLNSFVHIVMYSYYLLAGLGPKVQKYLWWKKYITMIQLIQFIYGSFHFIILVFGNDSRCNLPKAITALYLTIGIVFFTLFFNFYKKAYNAGKKMMHTKEDKIETAKMTLKVNNNKLV